jgi:outer membrane protein
MYEHTYKIILVLLAIFSTGTCLAQNHSSNFELDFFANYSTSIYKGVDSGVEILPFLSYDSDSFFLQGTSIGYHASKEIDFSLNYNESFFDPINSDDNNIKKLDERKGGLTAKSSIELGVLKIELEQDLSGESDGFSANSLISIPLYYSSYTLIGSIGYTYNSEKLSQHLYSVSFAESTRTSGAIATHTSKSTHYITYGISMIKPLSKKITLTTDLTHIRFSDNVEASSIVTKNNKTAVKAILTYNF